MSTIDSDDRQGGANEYLRQYSLEILSKGSEAAEPSVFLAVAGVKRSTRDHDYKTLARYAVLGLGDMTGRLVADQKLSWTKVKAVFSHNNHHAGVDGCCMSAGIAGGGLWGLPALLMALRQSGAPDLTVVTGNEQDMSTVEKLAKSFAVVTHPRVSICGVPFSAPIKHDVLRSGVVQWWQVYEDQYLQAHAACSDQLENLIYLFSCRQSGGDFTIAALPSRCAWGVFVDTWSAPERRLVLGPGHTQPSIQVILTLSDNPENDEAFRSRVQVIIPKASVLFCCRGSESGELLQAQHLVQTWHEVLPKHILCRPLRMVRRPLPSWQNGMVYLSSCSSFRCTQPPAIVDRRGGRSKRTFPDKHVVMSLLDFLEPHDNSDGDATPDENEINIDMAEMDETPQVNLSVVPPVQKKLDGFEEIDCPHLLVLGTGCAAPGPLRGSSGYGLLLPQILDWNGYSSSGCIDTLLLTTLVECGDGVTSMLLSHLPRVKGTVDNTHNLHTHLRHLKFIWISHPHWDHYGGLPALVSIVHKARSRNCSRNQTSEPNESIRVQHAEHPLMIVAPGKVLDYLEIALPRQPGHSGSHETDVCRWLKRCTHQQTHLWWPFLSSIEHGTSNRRKHDLKSKGANSSWSYRPFTFWTNISVDHSCQGAFGFVMGMRAPRRKIAATEPGAHVLSIAAKSTLVTFAFSGDTRPCREFIERCRADCEAFNQGVLSYMLHEATFDDSEQCHCAEKKHSSVSEALRVAADAGAEKLILTHFSQRYGTYPPFAMPPSCDRGPHLKVAFAMDGMLIPLRC